MAENVILAEQNITGFEYNELFGAFHLADSSYPFQLVSGNEYLIVWDGGAYLRTAFAFTAADGAECVGIGNTLAVGGENSGEPFCIVCDITNTVVRYFSLDQLTEHKIGIYQNVEAILEQQDIGFSEQDNGLFCGFANAEFVEGVKYLVIWDGSTYTGTAVWYESLNGLGVGNPGLLGVGENTGEPFSIGYVSDSTLYIFTLENDPTNNVAIYKVITQDSGNEGDEPGNNEGGEETTLYELGPFTKDDTYDTYSYQTSNPPFIIKPNTGYSVEWDESTFTCISHLTDGGFIVIGNMSLVDPSEKNTGEPVLIVYFENDDASAKILTIHTNRKDVETHKIKLTEINGVVLKNYSGRDVIYENVETVRLNTTYGGTQIFSKGEVTENVPVALDFTNSDTQLVTAPDGYLIKSIVINKPENLVSENIISDVNIAGIIGTNAGGTLGESLTEVTFCSHDGKVLLERYVFIGDPCPDPVGQGKITVSDTREDTETTSYGAFDGWSLIPGEAADNSILTNVTDPLTVYAAYVITSDVMLNLKNATFTYGADLFINAYSFKPGLTLVPGNTYFVEWDGKTYTCICVEKCNMKFGDGGTSTIYTNYIGCPSARGSLAGNAPIIPSGYRTGEPFYIDSTGIYTLNAATHSVKVYY